MQPASCHGESPEFQPPLLGNLGCLLGSPCSKRCVRVCVRLHQPSSGIPWRICRQWRGLGGSAAPATPPCPSICLAQMFTPSSSQIIPISLTSEFAAEAGQHLLKMCCFLFKLTFHVDECQGPRGHSQVVLWGLCGSAAAFPYHKSVSWPFLPKPYTTSAWPWGMCPASPRAPVCSRAVQGNSQLSPRWLPLPGALAKVFWGPSSPCDAQLLRAGSAAMGRCLGAV